MKRLLPFHAARGYKNCLQHRGGPHRVLKRPGAVMKQLTLLVDRAVGAASLAYGQLEVMVHRRLKK